MQEVTLIEKTERPSQNVVRVALVYCPSANLVSHLPWYSRPTRMKKLITCSESFGHDWSDYWSNKREHHRFPKNLWRYNFVCDIFRSVLTAKMFIFFWQLFDIMTQIQRTADGDSLAAFSEFSSRFVMLIIALESLDNMWLWTKSKPSKLMCLCDLRISLKMILFILLRKHCA